MSKIKSFYCNDVDKVWYDSSNVLYSECDDITDGLKVLRVTFKNGRTYQYYDVNVHDYLLFRENLKNYDLNNNELAFLLHMINKINQSLLITNFSDKEINLLEINSILENYSESIKEEGCDDFTEKLKEKLM